jgi:SAM-dependent methyltransferase
MPENFCTQVGKEHYAGKYDNVPRFVSYFCQIELIRKFKPDNVLEIGIGNKTVVNYLRQAGVQVTSCDFDEALGPDHVGDIRALPFSNASYDVVSACEVIEHIPWDDVDLALSEIHRVSRKYVLMSIPYYSAGFELIIKLPLINKIFKTPFIRLYLIIPYFFMPAKFDGQHYWEMGRRNFSKKKIRAALGKYFTIHREVKPLFNNYRYFFVMEKKPQVPSEANESAQHRYGENIIAGA